MESPRVWLLDAACMLVAILPCLILNLRYSPHKRGFFCSDNSIRLPYRPDTVSLGLLAGVFFPLMVLLLSSGEAYLVYMQPEGSRPPLHSYLAALYRVLGTYLFGLAVSQSFTDLAKFTTGRLRPNFLAVCDLDWARVNCSGLVQTESLCRGNPRNVTSSRLSFYSGHSSFTMYCTVFLVLYAQARLCRPPWTRLLRPTLQASLLAFPLYVAYTRVSDHKHHWGDVLTGLLLGALLGGLAGGCILDLFKVPPPGSCGGDEELQGGGRERPGQNPLSLSLSETSHPIDKTGSRRGSLWSVGEKVSTHVNMSLEKEGEKG